MLETQLTLEEIWHYLLFVSYLHVLLLVISDDFFRMCLFLNCRVLSAVQHISLN